ncbi:MAG: hypothetical protein JST01_05060 [Cyanobacteria bacterium SZAS TMP-1]|nr:hypothetical protein [Cyanobacteria bacterium SZAS TMP-1]
MKDLIDDLFDEWCQTTDALSNAFFYDNLKPIEDIIRQFGSIWADLRQMQALNHGAKGTPLSVKQQYKLDKLLKKNPQARLEELIDQLALLRVEWGQENHPVNNVIAKLRDSSVREQWRRDNAAAKENELAKAEVLCRRLLDAFKADCPDLHALDVGKKKGHEK